jgi:hypothetical protein
MFWLAYLRNQWLGWQICEAHSFGWQKSYFLICITFSICKIHQSVTDKVGSTACQFVY